MHSLSFENCRRHIADFVRSEAVLCAAFAAAAVSACFIHPSLKYLDYINVRVLELLFCLMAVTAGLQEQGFFRSLAVKLRKMCSSSAVLAGLLVMLCFFASMFITNDVALIVFVPFTIHVLKEMPRGSLIFVIVMETVAANLGSMATPVGNPQNLFLYSAYHLSIKDFFAIMAPWTAVSLLLIAAAMAAFKYLGPQTEAREDDSENMPQPQTAAMIRSFILFAVCLLTVAGAVSANVCMLLTLLWLLAADRTALRGVDYMLLLTFVCFFIFVGNTAQIPAIKEAIAKILSGRELWASAAVSQIISNVPAAVMLASFTDNAKELLLGVNLGGLGTLQASLASLISYRLYCKLPDAKPLNFLVIFSELNFGFLAVLLLLASQFAA